MDIKKEVLINKIWKQVHPGLSQTLAARLDEHRRWSTRLAQSLLYNQEIYYNTNDK